MGKSKVHLERDWGVISRDGLLNDSFPPRSSEKFNLPRTQHRKHLPIKNMSKQMFCLAWKKDLNATVIIGFSWITTIWNWSPHRRM